jgi:antitoxin component YwqK of YwqJK toxin-antitoxin module
MRRLTIISILITIAIASAAQINTSKEGEVFYGEGNKPFTGVFHEYWENGNIKQAVPFRKGIISGEVVVYFSDKSRNEIRSYKSGKMHGIWITWDEKGNKIAEASYRKGKKDGKWYVWDENGTLRYDMTYKNGEKSGTWFMWDEKGTILMEKKY